MVRRVEHPHKICCAPARTMVAYRRLIGVAPEEAHNPNYAGHAMALLWQHPKFAFYERRWNLCFGHRGESLLHGGRASQSNGAIYLGVKKMQHSDLAIESNSSRRPSIFINEVNHAFGPLRQFFEILHAACDAQFDSVMIADIAQRLFDVGCGRMEAIVRAVEDGVGKIDLVTTDADAPRYDGFVKDVIVTPAERGRCSHE